MASLTLFVPISASTCNRICGKTAFDYLVVLGIIARSGKYGLVYRLLSVADRKTEQGREVAVNWQQLKDKIVDILQKSRLGQTIRHQPKPALNKNEKNTTPGEPKPADTSKPKTPPQAKPKTEQAPLPKQPTPADSIPPKTASSPSVTVLPEDRGWFNESLPTGLKRHHVTGEYIAAVDASVMVYVPGGDFFQGQESPTDPQSRLAPLPAQQTTLSAYYIDKYEVTNARFCKFLNSVAATSNDDAKKYLQIDSPYSGIEKSEKGYVSKAGAANYPVVQVSWHGADAYARWAGKMLPDERQWEKACRGGIEVPEWNSRLAVATHGQPDASP